MNDIASRNRIFSFVKIIVFSHKKLFYKPHTIISGMLHEAIQGIRKKKKKKAVEEFNKRVVNYGKEINEDFIRLTVVPFSILVTELIYKEGDDQYTNVGKVLKKNITALS
ncbi:hypothetical protein G4B88_000563 [Cannabis sativa]|uniref:Uncharacterized protein n=1 Tax=Cannabis sativa TaxID=3483 RepID=A0A7J6ER98_CANSA|nr:hypothetical protein G4B88_000563 [Cannabis sativa]